MTTPLTEPTTAAMTMPSLMQAPDYLRLYCAGDPERELWEFSYGEGEYQFRSSAIKRPLPAGEGYDLEAPCGYGGWWSNSDQTDFLQAALDAYDQACRDADIVAEFLRFHPLQNGPQRFSPWLDFRVHDRDIVTVPLVDREQRWAGYSKTTRNLLRRIPSAWKIQRNALAPERFAALYHATMDRNRAQADYYFSQDYFAGLWQLPGCQCWHLEQPADGAGGSDGDGEVMAALLFLRDGEVAFYHLSGNNENALAANANLALLDAAFDDLTGVGCQEAILGGGRSAASDDNLYRFKTKFSRARRPYWIGGRIFDHARYRALSADYDNNRFLPWR